jgi:3-hydroxyisobutyrate dehydrogenase-like beta-hydroxyacid dehydrogenase
VAEEQRSDDEPVEIAVDVFARSGVPEMRDGTTVELGLVVTPVLDREAVEKLAAELETLLAELDEMRRHEYPAGFPVRLALKDLELVREVEQSSRASMPLLEAVLERFVAAGGDLAEQDVAAIYELDSR